MPEPAAADEWHPPDQLLDAIAELLAASAVRGEPAAEAAPSIADNGNL
jgi:hypothetical protein